MRAQTQFVTELLTSVAQRDVAEPTRLSNSPDLRLSFRSPRTPLPMSVRPSPPTSTPWARSASMPSWMRWRSACHKAPSRNEAAAATTRRRPADAATAPLAAGFDRVDWCACYDPWMPSAARRVMLLPARPRASRVLGRTASGRTSASAPCPGSCGTRTPARYFGMCFSLTHTGEARQRRRSTKKSRRSWMPKRGLKQPSAKTARTICRPPLRRCWRRASPLVHRVVHPHRLRALSPSAF